MSEALERLCLSSLLLAAALSVFLKDWMWLAVSLSGAAVLLLPRLPHEGLRHRHHPRIVAMAALPPLAYIVVSLVPGIPEAILLAHAAQSAAAVLIGLMLMVLVDRRSATTLSKRWMIIMSVAFAVTVSVISTFSIYVYMSHAGYPLFEEYFEGLSLIPYIHMLMAPMNVATPATVIYALLVRRALSGIPKEELTLIRGGD